MAKQITVNQLNYERSTTTQKWMRCLSSARADSKLMIEPNYNCLIECRWKSQLAFSLCNMTALSGFYLISRNVTSCIQVIKPSIAPFHRYTKPYSERHHEKNYVIRDELDSVAFPAERRKLHPLLRTPVPAGGGDRMYKYPRRYYDMRGPETVHNLLNHSQFGIQVFV